MQARRTPGASSGLSNLGVLCPPWTSGLDGSTQRQSNSGCLKARHPGVRGGSVAILGGKQESTSNDTSQLDMSALDTLPETCDGALSPEKCPSPLQLTPRHSAQGPNSSLDGRTSDHYSNNSSLQNLPAQLQYSGLPFGPQQQHPVLPEHTYRAIRSAPCPSLTALIQNSISSSMQCEPDPSTSRDDILMDFWALLQQTQQNLQDMLVDLETAKIELDLANGRADDAETSANSLKVQLAAAQQKNNALEGQLQHLQSREADVSAKAATLTQRNTELNTELHQAQRAAATLELKLERLQLQLAAAQKEKAVAAAQAAAAANTAATPAAVAAQEAAVAAAQALVTQLKTELSQTRSELASTQSRAARAELELAVAKTKVLVAQQEASASADRCNKVEAENTTLKQQLGAATATAEVAAADKQKLEQQIELLTMKVEQKESRLRSSMSAMARASTSLRASFSAQGGLFDGDVLRSSSHVVADIIRKSADIKSLLRASQQQQQHQRYSVADDNTSSSSGSSTPSGLLTPQACPPVPEAPESSTPSTRGSSVSDSSSSSGTQDSDVSCVSEAGCNGLSVDGNVRTSSPFAAAAVQDSSNPESATAGPTDADAEPQTRTSATTGQAGMMNDCPSSQSTSRPSSSHSIQHPVMIDRQSPIFKKQPSGRSSGGGGNSSQSILSPRPGSTAGFAGTAASLTPQSKHGKSSSATAGLPPRPRRTSSSGLSTGGKSPTMSPRSALGFSLSPAGSSTPNLMSPAASRRSSSSGGSSAGGSSAAAHLPCGVLYVPNSSSSKAVSRRCGSSSSSSGGTGCGLIDCLVCSHQLSIAAGGACAKKEASSVAAETNTSKQGLMAAMADAELELAAQQQCAASATTISTQAQGDKSKGDSTSNQVSNDHSKPAANPAARSDAVPEAAACVPQLEAAEVPEARLSLCNLPPLRIPPASAARIALPLSPLMSPLGSPMASRHVCKITQFAAAAPSSVPADSGSSGSMGLVSAAIAAWESQTAVAAAAGSKECVTACAGPPEDEAGGACVVVPPEEQHEPKEPSKAEKDLCSAIVEAPAVNSAPPEAGDGSAALEAAVIADSDADPELDFESDHNKACPANEPHSSTQDDIRTGAGDASDPGGSKASSRGGAAALEAGLVGDSVTAGSASDTAAAAAAAAGSGSCGPADGTKLALPRRARVPKCSIQRWLVAAVIPASSVVVGALLLSVKLMHRSVGKQASQQQKPQLASTTDEE